MTCTSCGDKPKGSSKGFPRAVVEINNPESLVLLRKVVIPASMGTEEDVPPAIGKYFNVLLQYEANGHIYLYSSDGIPTAIEANIPQEVLDRIDQLEIDVDLLETGLANETTAREAADSALSSSINSLSSSLSAETAAREQADTTLQNNIAAEATARANADTNLQNQITQEAQARAAADTAINGAITAEASTRQTADAGLQSQIDAITASSDVKDIVGTKAELNNYDTSTLGNNDIIKVLQDESENDATTYYRWNATTQQFTLVGEEGPYYTKSQADTLLNAKQNTLTAGSNVQIVNDTISATDTTYTAGTGLALNGTQFSVDTTAIATQSDLTAGLATKQDTLTAGSNIQISNNTISATDTTYTAGNGLSLVGTEFSADTTVLATQTDLATKQDVLTAGSNIQINGSTISATDTTYSDFTGTDGTTAGTAGLVPAPATTDAGKFLKADGTWDTAGSAINVVQTTGTSTTSVMSQNATTSMVFADPSTKEKIQIGAGANTTGASGVCIGKMANNSFAAYGVSVAERASVTGSYGVAIGYNSLVNDNFGVAIGSYSHATQRGQFDISSSGSGGTTYGYNGSQYRLLTGLYDPQSAHDAATKGYVDNSLLGKQDALTAGSGISIADESGSLVISATGGGGGLDPNTTFWGQTAINGAVTGRITFGTNGYVNGTNSTVTVYADTAGGADPFEFSHTGLDVASKKITNLAAPTANGDAANKNYVDTATSGKADITYVNTQLDGKQDELTAGTGITITDESGALVISATAAEPDTFTTNEWNALWA